MFNKMYAFFVVCAGLLLLPACWPWSNKTAVQETEKKFILLDVNEPEVYQDAHIKGAVHVPFEKIEEFVKPLSKDVEIVVYCSNYMCGTSSMVWKKLQDLGFVNSHVYEGGTAEWYQLSQGDPSYIVEGPGALEFLKQKVEKPEGPEGASAITAQVLKQKMSEHKSERKACCAGH